MHVACAIIHVVDDELTKSPEGVNCYWCDPNVAVWRAVLKYSCGYSFLDHIPHVVFNHKELCILIISRHHHLGVKDFTTIPQSLIEDHDVLEAIVANGYAMERRAAAYLPGIVYTDEQLQERLLLSLIHI